MGPSSQVKLYSDWNYVVADAIKLVKIESGKIVNDASYKIMLDPNFEYVNGYDIAWKNQDCHTCFKYSSLVVQGRENIEDKFLNKAKSPLLAKINKGEWDEAIERELKEACGEFVKQ